MSRIVNKGSYKPGSIYRIALENFVTYKEVEFYPGKSLNLIIGPNGTGKSTFVCAIILGLCGKPSVIGRAKTISGFVSHGCESASIEIELYNHPGQKNIIIKRTFNIQNTSTWSMDYKPTSEKKIQEKIKSFNIQVDNLCQLLPQEKVHDFSKMNPKEILQSTLTAIGGSESVEDWEKLIKLKNDQINLTSDLQDSEKRLQNERRQYEGLKERIDAMNQRKSLEKEIELCEKKLLWAEYVQLHDQVSKIKHDQAKAEKVVKKNVKTIEPLENELAAVKDGITALEGKKLATSGKIQNLKDKVKDTIKLFELRENKVKDIDISFEEKKELHRNRERELAVAKAKEEKLISDKRDLERDGGDENRLILELQKLKKERDIRNASMETYRKNKEDQLYPLDYEMKSLRYNIQSLEDVHKNRLEKLSTRHADTYKAWLWLEKNMNEFEQPVYGPMMLNINFTDPKFARYLESTVPVRDLKAFTFESKRDMNHFNKIVREKLSLKQVNAVHSEGGDFNIQSRDIRSLSYLGFYTCLLDTITAPTAILRYLCSVYRIHNIPIGNTHTFNNQEKVPENITYYFTENHRITARVSHYRVRSTTTIEIRIKPDMLADSVDEDHINTLKSKLLDFEQRKQSLVSEIDAHLTSLGNELQQIEMKMREKSEFLDKVKSTKMKIHIQRNKVRALENEPAIDIEEEKAKCREEKKNCVNKQCQSHQDMCRFMNTIWKHVLEMEQGMIHLSVLRNSIVEKDSEYRKLTSELALAKTTLENIENNLKAAAIKAREKLEEAKKSCNNKMINESDFPYANEFERMPSNVEQLEDYRNERLTKLSLMDKGDNQVLKEYEKRQMEIKNLEKILSTSSKSKDDIRNKIDKIKSQWLPKLESMVKQISDDFSSMFQKLGCVGEIILHKGANDEEFSSYGLNIMVQFRAGESMTQLTRQTQSGGERALSTALYLLALQARVAVPFRCVDEINQGMDEKNERDMLQLLIRAITESDSQYFLLTPKLLPNLEYNEKTTIHTVMKGCHIFNYKKWKMNDFIQNASKISQN